MKNPVRPQRKKRYGFTLTEIALVMGVVGSILGAIWYASGQAKEAQKETDAAAELQIVASNIDGAYAGHTFSATGNLTATLLAAQVIPPVYQNAATPGTADHAWGPGLFVVYGMPNTAPSPAAPTPYYRISFYGVSRSGCIALMMSATNCEAGQLGCPFLAITNAGHWTKAPDALGWPDAVTATVASAGCNANTYPGSSATNSLEFDYKL